MAPTQVFYCECCKIFKNSFFYITPLVTAFMSTRKGRRKRGKKEQGKIFQMKEKNENILFNFYLQVLVLVKTEMQIQLCKYRTAHLFSYFFFKFSFLWFLHIYYWKISVTFISIFRSRHWELFLKTAARKDITKTVNFVLQNWS